MSEVLRSFNESIRDASGEYHARVVGRPATDGMWEGWFEFVPLAGDRSEPLVSSVESRQPKREHLAYWAEGLSQIYAEGALQRARRPVTVRARAIEMPVSHEPAPRIVTLPPRVVGPEPVMDPFDVGSKSLDVLAQELGALGRPRLLNIIAAYDLNPRGEELQAMSDAQLITFIVVSVETALMHRTR